MVALREPERSDTVETGGAPETETTEVTKMSKTTWMQRVFAAIVVILAGGLSASAEDQASRLPTQHARAFGAGILR